MPDKVRQRLGKLAASLLLAFVAGLLPLCLYLLVYSYLSHPTAFNSDNLLCVEQCDDLLHGRDLTEWHLPGAPYVFPDLLFLAPCQALTPHLPAAFLAYGFLLHLSVAAVLAWLGRLTGLGWRTALTAAGCGVILLAAMNLRGDIDGRDCLLVHPGSHVGAILLGLFLLALTVYSLRRGSSWMTALLFLAIGGLGIFSDNLLVPQFLAPLALALILLTARRVIRVRQASVLIAVMGSAFLLSLAIAWCFQRLGFHLLQRETTFGRLRLPDLFTLLRRLYHGIADDWLLCILFPLHLLAAALIVRRWLRPSVETLDDSGLDRRAIVPSVGQAFQPDVSDVRLESLTYAEGLDRRAILLASLALALSPLCIVATLFVAGMAHHGAINRYTLSCWFLPALLLPLLMCWLPGRSARTLRVLLQVGVLLFAAQRAASLLPRIDAAKFEQPYPPLAQELDRLARERGPLRGLASFWTARSTSWFTREDVVVNPLSGLSEPWFHACNPARFLPEDGGELRMPEYQFLLVRPGDSFAMTPGVLALRFGVPDKKIAVGTDEIWLYDSLRVSPFERFLRSRLAARLHRRRGGTGPIEPACLAHPKANLSPAGAPGNVLLEAGQTCEVRFAQPITGQLLDIGANFENRLDLDFFRGEERLGTLPVPSVPWTGSAYGKPGMQSRLVPLPAALRDRPWDRIVVRPRLGAEKISLGHVLVFAESIPGLDAERPTPRPQRVRLEAEGLLPLNPGTPFTDESEPAASAGRVRRDALDMRCSPCYTPCLFLPPGRYRLECTMKVDDNSGSGELASLHVGCLSLLKPLAERSLRGRDFPSAGRWIAQTLIFEIPQEIEAVQIGILSAGKTPLTVDYLDVIAEPPEYPGEKP